MFVKFALLAAVVAVSSGFAFGPYGVPPPIPPIVPPKADPILFGGPFIPQPYKFGYNVKDKHGEQHRQEVGNGKGHVTGSYGFTDDRGIHRQVHYIADHLGFRAKVITNEPGTANQHPAAVIMESAQG